MLTPRENPLPLRTLKNMGSQHDFTKISKDSAISPRSMIIPQTSNTPGVSHPFQLLKYSAISRCGMMQANKYAAADDPSKKPGMIPKINQDSFKVQKGFPAGTKAFNWMFELFDGHGPHGELMS